MAFVGSFPVVSARVAPAVVVSSFQGTSVNIPRRSRPVGLSMNLDTLRAKIVEETKKAQDATAKFGKTSREAALAWDTVEELEAKVSHMKAEESKDPLDKYCEEAPEADECRVYED